jgi:hypothetical protein
MKFPVCRRFSPRDGQFHPHSQWGITKKVHLIYNIYSEFAVSAPDKVISITVKIITEQKIPPLGSTRYGTVQKEESKTEN